MSKLFEESPMLAAVPIIGATLAYCYRDSIGDAANYIIGTCIVVFIALLAFYRYTPYENRFADKMLVSPCEGTVLLVEDRYDHFYIPIFLSVFNKHYQIYPSNGTVIERKYDHTGQFEIVMHLDKSADNEKKIHTIQMKNGAVYSVTQLAGFLPRMITSSDVVPMDVRAGEYMGMIKFGSRVDLLIPKKAPDDTELVLRKNIVKGAKVSIGDVLGSYEVSLIRLDCDNPAPMKCEGVPLKDCENIMYRSLNEDWDPITGV